MGDEKEYDKVMVLSQTTALTATKIVSVLFELLGNASPRIEKMVVYCCMAVYFSNGKCKEEASIQRWRVYE
jgi:hypothetical protein